MCVLGIEALLWTHPDFSYLEGLAEHAHDDHIDHQIDGGGGEE